MVGVRFATVMLNPANEAVPPLPSETEMIIPLVTPRCADEGVPVSAPVAVLKAAQTGLLMIV